METILKTWNIKASFWECNPILLTVGAFKKLYDSDKSKNKNKSSKVMWSVALCTDMHQDNIWKTYKLAEKQALIKEDYLEDKNFDWEHETIIELIETYTSFCMTKLEKDLVSWENKLEQRSTFLNDEPYTMDNAKELDVVFLNSEKISIMISNIREKISEESDKGQMKGGATESLSEQGEI